MAVRRRPPPASQPLGGVLSASLLGGVLVYILLSFLPKNDARPLAFPLEGGRFMIGQGGANPLLNHHFSHRSQRHAADITAVNAAGFRASGLLPDDLKSYVIFDAVVVSPCDGVVVSAENDLPDLTPPNADPMNPVGNHLTIACDGIEIELAHLRKGGVTVGKGDAVAARQRVARVGNSGNTTEPHLHIHAVEPSSGEGVPMTFNGRAPIRSSMFRR